VRRLTVPASAACAALIAAGCGANSASQLKPRRVYTYGATTAVTTKPAPPPPSAAAIKHAAALTAAKPGFQARVSARIDAPRFDGSPLTAIGSGYFDPTSNSGTLDLAVSLPGLFSLVGPVPTQVIAAGDEAYVKVPPDLASYLPGSAQWLEASLDQLDVSSINPTVILQQLARDATSNVPGQRARVTIDPRTGLVRSVLLTYTELHPRYHVRVTLRFTGFKAEPPSPVPASGDVGQLAPVLQQLGF
jgi:hypothetical protein